MQYAMVRMPLLLPTLGRLWTGQWQWRLHRGHYRVDMVYIRQHTA